MGFLSSEEISNLGFKNVGCNAKLSSRASYYNCANISIADNVRVDDFVVISAGVGGIEIGSHIHIAVFCSLIGAEKIELQDFSNLSSRVSIYSSSDDFSGNTMTNPTIPDEFKSVYSAPVIVEQHVIIGAGSVILPGVTLEKGVAIGALSLVSTSCKAFGVYAGAPAKFIKNREKTLLEIEKLFRQERKIVEKNETPPCP